MTVRLRAHHLLCLLTWAGKGYNPAFTAGFSAIVGRIAAGEDVAMVDGPDDVCAPMLESPDCHCRDAGVTDRDARAARDVAVLLGRPVAAGQRLTLDGDTLARLRHAFAGGGLRDACAGCEWSDLCGDIAANGFSGTVLPPQPDRLRA